MAPTRYCDAATTRELIGLHARAASKATDPVVIGAAAALRAALTVGGGLELGLRLQLQAPSGLDPFHRELYGAAISLASALWHVETGTPADQALDKALEHLNAALDQHAAAAGGPS